MERNPYYITMQAGVSNAEIRSNKGESSYDFEIVATNEEAELLKELFEQATLTDNASYWHAHVNAAVTDIADRDHMIYDRLLNQVYQTIYNLGTDQTKADIKEMGVLELTKEKRPKNTQTGPNMLQ